MGEDDFSKLQGLQFNPIKLDTSYSYNLAQSALEGIERNREEAIRAVQEAREEKEAEQLRQHNELVNAIREAGEKGSSIIIGDNANSIQIQQNSAGASQTMLNTTDLDYEKVIEILEEIKTYFDFPQFKQTYKDNTENVKNIVEFTLQALNTNEDDSIIRKSLKVLKDITIGVGGSLIASGILGLLGQLPI